jgi:transcriptional regulator with XRE-family HTH domain
MAGPIPAVAHSASAAPPEAPAAPVAEGRHIVDGELVITFAQAMKELGWSRCRLAGMQFDCPYLDAGVLAFRRAQLPVPYGRNGAAIRLRMRVISAATFDQLKQQAEAVRRGRFTHKGTCYLSWTRALLELGVSASPINQKAGPLSVVQPTSRDQLLNWRRGCPLLGRPLKAKLFKFKQQGRGGPECWYVEDDILRLKEALLAEIGKAQKRQGSFPSILRDLRIQAGLSQAELAEKGGFSADSVRLWEQGRRLPARRQAKLLAKALKAKPDELRLPKARPPQAPPHLRFNGIFRDSDGRVIGLAITQAARRSGLGYKTIQAYTSRLPAPFVHLFPVEGRLPSKWLLVPGTASVWRLTVHPDDLKRLSRGIAKILRDGVQRSKKLLSLHDVLDHFGVHGARDRWHAGAMLTALGKGGVLKALKVTRPARRPLRWITSQRYDRDQVARLLDRHGCGLAQLAANWANGELDISKERPILPGPDPAVVEEPPKAPFIPTPFQKRILEALENRFRNADNLLRHLKCDRKRLYYDRKGRGLKELMAEGWVANDRSPGRGYYRPDAPPKEIAEFLGENGQIETKYPTAGN